MAANTGAAVRRLAELLDGELQLLGLQAQLVRHLAEQAQRQKGPGRQGARNTVGRSDGTCQSGR